MKLSNRKIEKIYEQILANLYSHNPKPIFTSHIASELARDEEFIKKLLFALKKKELVLEIKKNSKGEIYSKRSRWKLTKSAYESYQKMQF
jgi:predicted transcriptional regulator